MQSHPIKPQFIQISLEYFINQKSTMNIHFRLTIILGNRCDRDYPKMSEKEYVPGKKEGEG